MPIALFTLGMNPIFNIDEWRHTEIKSESATREIDNEPSKERECSLFLIGFTVAFSGMKVKVRRRQRQRKGKNFSFHPPTATNPLTH